MIAHVLTTSPDALILAPLAVGGHVDHVELFLAAVEVMFATDAYDRFRFYEDAYAMSGAARRRHFLAGLRRWPFGRSPALAGVGQTVMLLAWGWAARGPRLEEYCPRLVSTLRWTSEPFPLEGFEPVKFEALRCYEFQMERLGGYARFSAMVRRWHAASGGAEWLWRAELR